MIEVLITHRESGAELGRIHIENVSEDGEFGDYSIQFGVEKIASIGLHQRAIMNFPRKRYNVLALLRQALETLEPRDLELDGKFEDRTYTKRRSLLRRGFL